MKIAAAVGGDGSQTGADTSHLYIRKVVLSNFKKFESLQLDLNPDLNIFAGDNEAGKSTVLTAIDLTLSASRSKVRDPGH